MWLPYPSIPKIQKPTLKIRTRTPSVGLPRAGCTHADLAASEIESIFFNNEDRSDKERGCLILEKYRITDVLTLEYVKSPLHLKFKNCIFDHHINFRGAQFASLMFSECKIATFDGLSLVVEQNLTMSPGLEAAGTIRLTNAKIGGRMNLRGAQLNEGGADKFTANNEFHVVGGSLFACNMEVKGSLFLDSERGGGRKFCSTGTITLRGAIITGRLYFQGAILIPSKTMRLFDGNGELKSGASTEDYILSVTTIDGYQMEVRNSAHFSDEFKSYGLIRISGAKFGAKVTFKGAEVSEYKYHELSLIAGRAGCDNKQLEVIEKKRAGAELRKREELKRYPIAKRLPRGAIDAFTCKIGGSLYFGVEDLKNASGAIIDDDDGFTSDGAVAFQEARINARVIVANAEMKCGDIFKTDEHVKRSYSLDFGSAIVDGSFHIRQGSWFFGAIRVRGMTVGRRFSISGTSVTAISSRQCDSHFYEFTGRRGAFDESRERILKIDEAGVAESVQSERMVQLRSIDGAHLTVAQDVSIDCESEFYGTIDFRNIKVGSDIKVVGSVLYSPIWSDEIMSMSRYEKKFQRNPLLVCLNLDGCVCRNILFFENALSWRHDGRKNVIWPRGNVYIHDARVSDTLDIRGDKFTFLTHEAMGDPFSSNWNPCSRLHLEQTKTGTLRDDIYSPTRIRFYNFLYDVVHRESLGDLLINERVRRLGPAADAVIGDDIPRPFRAQPYDQLSRILFISGDSDQSNRVITEKLRAHLCEARSGDGERPWVSTVCRWIFSYFGYGMAMASTGFRLYFYVALFAAGSAFTETIMRSGTVSDFIKTWILIIWPKFELPTVQEGSALLWFIALQLIHGYCYLLLILIGLGLVKNYSNRSHGA